MTTRLAPSVAPLFVPGDRPDRFAKAALSGADAVIIDLEDAVAPAEKAKARAALRSDFTTLPVYVRVNAMGTPWHAEDLAAAQSIGAAAIIMPKAAEGPDLAALILDHTDIPLIALIESAQGVASARSLAANPAIVRLAFGSVDYCADIGCAHTRSALLSARSELVLASRLSSSAAPLDGVTTMIEDLVLAEDDARHAAELGFGGKLCIHPKQVSAVLQGMRPTAAEVAWAESVLSAGSGASAMAGAMIDNAVKLRAGAVLRRATPQQSLD